MDDYSTHRQTPLTDNDSSLLHSAKRSNGSALRVQTIGPTDRHTNGQTDVTKYIISLLSRKINLLVWGNRTGFIMFL